MSVLLYTEISQRVSQAQGGMPVSLAGCSFCLSKTVLPLSHKNINM